MSEKIVVNKDYLTGLLNHLLCCIKEEEQAGCKREIEKFLNDSIRSSQFYKIL